MSTPTKHGLNPQQWTELYDRGEWRQHVLSAVHAVACCEHAHPQDREEALAVWGALLDGNFVAEAPVDGDFRPLPVVVRDTQLSIVRGRKGALDEAVRKEMHERLEGVKQVLFAVTNFKMVSELAKEEAKQASVPFVVDPHTAN